MKWVIAGGIGILGLCVMWIVTPAHAATFDLSSCSEAGLPADCNNKDTGLTHIAFTSGGFILNTSGNDTLDLKVNGPGETGLGIFSEANHEVDSSDVITLNFADLAAHGATSGELTVASLQTGEIGIVHDETGSHPITEVGDTLTATLPIAFSAAHPDVTLTAAPGDVLAASSVAAVPVSVPEPAPWVLLGTGVVAVWRRCRR